MQSRAVRWCSARGQRVRCRWLLLRRRPPLRCPPPTSGLPAGLVPLRAEHERRWTRTTSVTVAATQSYPADVGWKDTPVIYCADATGKSASVRFAGHRAQIGVGHGLLAAHLDLDGTAWPWSARPGQSRPGAVELLLSSVSCCRQMCCLIFFSLSRNSCHV